GDAAVRRDVDLGHPPANAIGIELRVPGRIERVREVDAPAIAADLDHLRSAIEGARFTARMGLAPNDATDRERAAEPRLEGVRYVVLSHLAGSPAAHIEKAVVEIGRFGGDLDNLPHLPAFGRVVMLPHPDG